MMGDKEVGYILHKAAMLSKYNFTNKLNGIGITPGQFIVLKEIYYHQKNTADIGLSPAAIADRLQSDRPTISGIIDRLEAQEWVERLDNIQDRRSFLIRITDKAEDKIKQLEDISTENSSATLKGFTEEEIISFKNFLLRVIDNFRDAI